jgi:hypothetical protein
VILQNLVMKTTKFLGLLDNRFDPRPHPKLTSACNSFKAMPVEAPEPPQVRLRPLTARTWLRG